jgi:hypothetical protein
MRSAASTAATCEPRRAGVARRVPASAPGALLNALVTRPLALVALLAQGWRLGRGVKGIAYAIKALMA